MHVTKVFRRLLCLQAVHVTDVEFRADAVAVFIDVQLRQQTLTCSRCCRRRRAGTYDSKVRLWRHLDLGAWEVYLRARQRRFRCPPCNAIVTEAVPLWRSGGGAANAAQWSSDSLRAVAVCERHAPSRSRRRRRARAEARLPSAVAAMPGRTLQCSLTSRPGRQTLRCARGRGGVPGDATTTLPRAAPTIRSARAARRPPSRAAGLPADRGVPRGS